MMIRRHYWFSGRVQGVGFRYRAYYIAGSLGITGWVRNNWDERVEMEAQGTEESLQLLNLTRLSKFISVQAVMDVMQTSRSVVQLFCHMVLVRRFVF